MKIWCLSLICLASAAAAEPAANPVSSAHLAVEGDRLFKGGQYRDAAEVLRQAYALDPSPLLLFNIARAYDQAGQLQIALVNYRAYLALGDTEPALARHAMLAVDRLHAVIAQGETDAALTQAEQLRAEADAELAKAKAEAEANAERRQREAYAEAERKRLDDADTFTKGRRIGALSAAGAAVIGAGLGITFGLMSSKSQLAFAEGQATTPSSRSQSLISNVSFSFALAAAIIAAIVFPWATLTDPNSAVQLAFTPSGGGLTARF